MLVKIDEFGRVLIPKRIRDHLGFKPGITIKLEEKGEEKLIMKVLHEDPVLEICDGVLVFKGAAHEEIDDALHEVRNERMRKLAGD